MTTWATIQETDTYETVRGHAQTLFEGERVQILERGSADVEVRDLHGRRYVVAMEVVLVDRSEA